jgi:hypothetical protein
VREKDEVEGGQAWVCAYQARAAGQEGVFSGRGHDAQSERAQLSEGADAARESFL